MAIVNSYVSLPEGISLLIYSSFCCLPRMSTRKDPQSPCGSGSKKRRSGTREEAGCARRDVGGARDEVGPG